MNKVSLLHKLKYLLWFCFLNWFFFSKFSLQEWKQTVSLIKITLALKFGFTIQKNSNENVISIHNIQSCEAKRMDFISNRANGDRKPTKQKLLQLRNWDSFIHPIHFIHRFPSNFTIEHKYVDEHWAVSRKQKKKKWREKSLLWQKNAFWHEKLVHGCYRCATLPKSWFSWKVLQKMKLEQEITLQKFIGFTQIHVSTLRWTCCHVILQFAAFT